MGRIREMIKVDGRECWTLFDTGARNTYVIPKVAEVLTTSETAHPIRTALGGGVKMTNKTALLQAEVEGHLISTHAMVVDEIGADEDGRAIEILFGALAMQQWEFVLFPTRRSLTSATTLRNSLSSNFFTVDRSRRDSRDGSGRCARCLATFLEWPHTSAPTR